MSDKKKLRTIQQTTLSVHTATVNSIAGIGATPTAQNIANIGRIRNWALHREQVNSIRVHQIDKLCPQTGHECAI